ncbi:PREDICTED: alcohol dehydrogenase-like 6 isoform X2 [Camelina sativa]|uniref:Alcohol dehydrogenase-like 6 isoform X2 n=1 Tax=Camelina sativa TaxID=90675 RepID=A0ABM1R3H3_CAMSA|nr:PREDICTED: alcohol dehydrogenase-like 6 isoform X2 [Camelina sativa]
MVNSSLKNHQVLVAAVAWCLGEPLVMEEVVVSPPQPLEIRIKWFVHLYVVVTSLLGSLSLFCHEFLVMKLQETNVDQKNDEEEEQLHGTHEQ